MKLSIFLTAVVFLSLHLTSANATEINLNNGEEFCIELSKLAGKVPDLMDISKQSGDSSKNINQLMEIAGAMNEIVERSKLAIKGKMTFQQFTLEQKNKGFNVPALYESLYIQSYVREYCGSPTVTDHGTIRGGQIVNATRTIKFPTYPADFLTHPYADELKRMSSGK